MKSPKLILAVDDDPDDRALFKEAVAEIDSAIRCVLAQDGFEALEFLNTTTLLPDFIFLDLNMPRMNGKECLIKIKEIKKIASIPVIMHSTSKSTKDESEFLNLGASLFLEKSCDFQDICTIISNVIFKEHTDKVK